MHYNTYKRKIKKLHQLKILLNDYLKTQSLGNNEDNTNQENGGNSTDNQDTEIDPELNLLSK